MNQEKTMEDLNDNEEVVFLETELNKALDRIDELELELEEKDEDNSLCASKLATEHASDKAELVRQHELKLKSLSDKHASNIQAIKAEIRQILNG